MSGCFLSWSRPSRCRAILLCSIGQSLLSIAIFLPLLSAQEIAAKTAINDYVFIQRGEIPIILSAPHGGTRELPGVSERKGEGMKTGGAGFFAGRDSGTEELAHAVSAEIEKRFGKKPYMVVSRTHRKYLDPNRPPEIAYEDEDAKPAYDFYHGTLTEYCKEVTKKHRTGMLLDLHGQGSKRDTVFRGTRNGTTIKHLRDTFGEEAFTGPRSLFSMLDQRGWLVHPKPFSGKEQPGFTGGHIVGTYGTYGTTSGTVIDAYQLEFGAEYRVEGQRSQTATQLADAVVEYADMYLKVTSAKEAAATTKKIRVAVFLDKGVSPIEKLIAVLESSDKLEIKYLKAEEIRAGALSNFDVLIHPGGTGGGQGKALEDDGREKVRQFVRDGKGLLGICAGAYLATCDYSWSLNLLDAKVLDRAHWNRGNGYVPMSLSPVGQEFFGSEKPLQDIHYRQGPLLAPANNPDIPDYEELGKFVGEIAENGAPRGVMPGTTAIARGTFEKGRVFCFSPHPEKTVGLEKYILEAIDWLSEDR